MVNVTLIPFLLEILTNIPESNFNPEYLYEVNQTLIEYGEFSIKSTELTSTITCHPLLMESLRCFLHDVMFMTSKYKNWNDDEKIMTSKLIQIGQWFEIRFNNNGSQSITFMELYIDKMIYNLIQNIIEQFNLAIDIEILYSFTTSSTVIEDTPIGACATTYKVHVNYRQNKEANSNFKIILLDNSSKPEDLYLKNLHITKNRKDCNYSRNIVDFLNGREMTKYVHTIDVTDNKLKIVTTLDGCLLDPNRKSSTFICNKDIFTQITQLNLINIRSQKTISFNSP